MGRPLSYQPEEWTYFELTFRCMQGRFLLRPGSEENRRFIGVLGRSLELYGDNIDLHFAGGTSNHIHLLIRSRTAQDRAAFKCHLKTNLAKELGRLHGWREHVFGRRSRDIPVLDDEAVRERLKYLAAHGVKEGLVETPGWWPGVQWVNAVTEGQELRGVWYDRTRLYRLLQAWEARKPSNRGPKPTLEDVATKYVVRLTPLPFMEHLDEGEQRAEWKRLVDEAVEAYPPERPKALGAEKVLEQNPHAKPRRMKNTPAPLVHSTRPDLRRQWMEAYRGFVTAFRAAMKRLREGLAAFEFPLGGVPPPGAASRVTAMA